MANSKENWLRLTLGQLRARLPRESRIRFSCLRGWQQSVLRNMLPASVPGQQQIDALEKLLGRSPKDLSALFEGKRPPVAKKPARPSPQPAPKPEPKKVRVEAPPAPTRKIQQVVQKPVAVTPPPPPPTTRRIDHTIGEKFAEYRRQKDAAAQRQRLEQQSEPTTEHSSLSKMEGTVAETVWDPSIQKYRLKA
jgi:hypothetical protein